MKLIAHRGLINGPDKALENNPVHVEKVLKQGYDAEVDLWLTDDGLFLGHDGPVYPVDLQWLRQPGLWVHAKNLPALFWLSTHRISTYFWHQEDHFTLTNTGFIWTYPGQELTPFSVLVMPELIDPTLENTRGVVCHGICSDFVERVKMQCF